MTYACTRKEYRWHTSSNKVVVIKWFMNLGKKEETPIMNISGTPVMIATRILERKLLYEEIQW